MEPQAPTYGELAALVSELRERVARLERQNADLRRENAQRRQRLEQKPPGPPPFAKPSVPPRRKHKKPGRPAGHPPALRPPPPPDRSRGRRAAGGGRRRKLPVSRLPAERAIRPAVLLRKVSGGHRGATTATAAATVMSVLRTARQQGKNLIATLKYLVQRHLAGQPCDLFTQPAQ